MAGLHFSVPGDPIALKRHRHTKKGFTYDPSKRDKANFLMKCLDYKPKKPLTGAISMKLGFYFKRPKSHYGTGKNANRVKESAPMNHIQTPDLDNLVKFLSDAFNGTFYKDDSQINNLLAFKDWDEYSHVDITIKEL